MLISQLVMCTGTLCTLAILAYDVYRCSRWSADAGLSAEHVAVLAVLAVLLAVLAVLLFGPPARERVARGQHGVNAGSTRGQHGVNTGSTRGQHGVNTGSIRGQHGVNAGSTRKRVASGQHGVNMGSPGSEWPRQGSTRGQPRERAARPGSWMWRVCSKDIMVDYVQTVRLRWKGKEWLRPCRRRPAPRASARAGY